MAKNYFDRYIWLVDLINRSGYIKFEDISRAWAHSALNTGESASQQESKLPQRTFFNHISAIYDTFGIEIKCDRNLGYYISNSDDLEGDDMRKWLLETLSMNNLLNESRDMRDRILFEKIPSSHRWLTVIVNAMRDGKAVDMTYQSYKRSEPHSFVAHPYCLKLFRQRWYVLAFNEEYGEPRIYALDERMVDIVPLKKKLRVPARFNAETYFSNFFGIIVWGGAPVTVDLKVYGDQVRYFESLPLHSSQKAVEIQPDYTVFRYRVVPTYDFIQEILRQGPDAEVLAPESLREEIRADIEAMSARYK